MKLLFNDLPQYVDSDGAPLSGGKLFTYVAGSSTKANVYQTDGGSAHTNPIVLDSSGRPPAAIWGDEGVTYKLVLAPAADTDPPASAIWTVDNVEGINDAANTADQWVSGPTPTYVSASSFTLVGDQTSAFHVGRRLKIADTAGTKYGTITASVFTALTTVTIAGDALATPTSAVSYGLLSATNPSIPTIATIWSTGDVKVTFKTAADPGWVLMNDGTIGNAASGGTTRANADTEALFTLLWTNTVDADCAVSAGRGASAAADYAANKTIALPKALGRSLAVYGAGSGLTSRALASVLGAETKTIGTTNLPASGLSVPSLSVSATGTAPGGTGLGAGATTALATDATFSGVTGISGVSVSGSTGIGTTGNMGSGTALDIMNPRFHANVMVKL